MTDKEYINSTVKLLSRVQLFAPMDCSPPDYSVHGIFQVTILDLAAISFSRGSSQPRDRTWVKQVKDLQFLLKGY